MNEKHRIVRFFLGKRSLLVLRFASCEAVLDEGGLPVPREPALLGHRSVSADWSAQAGCRSGGDLAGAVSIE